MTLIQQKVRAAIDVHGSLRKAGKVLGINYAYLCRLANGKKTNPTDRVLRKLGLKRSEEISVIR
jgi:hypothetical protein